MSWTDDDTKQSRNICERWANRESVNMYAFPQFLRRAVDEIERLRKEVTANDNALDLCTKELAARREQLEVACSEANHAFILGERLRAWQADVRKKIQHEVTKECSCWFCTEAKELLEDK